MTKFILYLTCLFLISCISIADEKKEFLLVVSSEANKDVPVKLIFDFNDGLRYSNSFDVRFPIAYLFDSSGIYLHDSGGDFTFSVEYDRVFAGGSWSFSGYEFNASKAKNYHDLDDVFEVSRYLSENSISGRKDIIFLFSKSMGILGFDIRSDSGVGYKYRITEGGKFECSECSYVNSENVLSKDQVRCLKQKDIDRFGEARCLYKGEALKRAILELEKEEERKKICSNKGDKHLDIHKLREAIEKQDRSRIGAGEGG